MSDQDNQKVGRSGNFLIFLFLIFIMDLFTGFKTLKFFFESGFFVTILVGAGIYGVYKLLRSSDDSSDDMEKTMAKYLPMCRTQVEDWIPPEEELMKEELYRRMSAYYRDHPWEGEWRNFKNPSYKECVYRRRAKRAERMAKRLAQQEINNRNK